MYSRCRKRFVRDIADADKITESGMPIARREGITLVDTAAGKTRWAVGSGSYSFKVSY